MPSTDHIFSADRAGPPREDLPLPTQAPYTAFVGNLAFDLTESELEEFFAGIKVRYVPLAGLDCIDTNCKLDNIDSLCQNY